MRIGRAGTESRPKSILLNAATMANCPEAAERVPLEQEKTDLAEVVIALQEELAFQWRRMNLSPMHSFAVQFSKYETSAGQPRART